MPINFCSAHLEGLKVRLRAAVIRGRQRHDRGDRRLAHVGLHGRHLRSLLAADDELARLGALRKDPADLLQPARPPLALPRSHATGRKGRERATASTQGGRQGACDRRSNPHPLARNT